LEEITGIKVELVTKKALKPRIGEYILREVVNI
jgi:predicted nucleotidyltransferase